MRRKCAGLWVSCLPAQRCEKWRSERRLGQVPCPASSKLLPSFSEERREGQGKFSLALSCATTLERWAARTTLRVTSARQLQVLVALSQFWHLQ